MIARGNDALGPARTGSPNAEGDHQLWRVCDEKLIRKRLMDEDQRVTVVVARLVQPRNAQQAGEYSGRLGDCKRLGRRVDRWTSRICCALKTS